MKYYVMVLGCILYIFQPQYAQAQSCSATVSGSQNWSALSWSCTGGGTPPTTNNTVYNQNITINGLGTGETLTIDRSVTINGNITLNAGGSTPTLALASGVNFRVTGSILNSNNNVRYIVNGTSILRVDGTLQGDNNTRFGGTGTVKGGTLNLGNNADCLSPCPTIGFTNCTSGQTGGVPNYFCVTYNNFQLPITLADFKAQEKGENVELWWKTITEKNNALFEIEHSTDSQNWKKIGEVEGAGNSNTAKEYTYLHTLPETGANYYRLKQVDFDRSYTYSNIVSAEIKSASTFVVFPNPSQDGIFWLKKRHNNPITVRAMDLVGKPIELVLTPSSVDNMLKLDLTKQPKGVYILTIQDQHSTKKQKIVFAK